MSVPKQLLTNPSGFPDLGPNEAIALRWMLGIIEKNFQLGGYVPIETPLVERTEILSAKAGGEISAQIYGIRYLNPSPDSPTDTKELALRFDQTVPLARFVAANYSALRFPFRRYVIGPVFRGERPKDGRYRQFIQADIDVIGDGTLNVLHDAEIVAVIVGIFTELAIGSFTVRIGNRKILEGLLESMGLPEEKFKAAAGAIDKIEKIGRAKVSELLIEMGLSNGQTDELLELLVDQSSTDEMLAVLREKNLNARFSEGVADLVKVIAGVRKLGVPENRFRVDLSIARGLDYYTGTVYETRFDAYPELGSIASGGRYDDLASAYTTRKLPGVGISIGVTRLLLRLIKEGLVKADRSTIAEVLVTTAEGLEENAGVYMSLAGQLRAAGIPTEIYLVERALGKQLEFASKRGFAFAVIARKEEIENGTVIIRNMETGDQTIASNADFASTVKSMLKK